MNGTRIVVPLAAHLGFIVIGVVVSRRVWQARLHRATVACLSLLLALSAQAVLLVAVAALTWTEALDLRGMAVVVLVVGALAGSGWTAYVVEQARLAILRGGGELSAGRAAFWLQRLCVPVAVGSTGAFTLCSLVAARPLVPPALVFVAVLCGESLLAARLLRGAALFIARR